MVSPAANSVRSARSRHPFVAPQIVLTTRCRLGQTVAAVGGRSVRALALRPHAARFALPGSELNRSRFGPGGLSLPTETHSSALLPTIGDWMISLVISPLDLFEDLLQVCDLFL